MATEYGLRLRQSRKHAKLTQAELSKKTGIPQSTISTAEREGKGSGETPVYARACGVDALWLATGEGEMLALNQTPPLAGEYIASGAIDGVAELVEKLGAALKATDPITREQSAPILAQLSKTPELAAELGARLEATIKMGTQAPFVPVNPFPKSK